MRRCAGKARTFCTWNSTCRTERPATTTVPRSPREFRQHSSPRCGTAAANRRSTSTRCPSDSPLCPPPRPPTRAAAQPPHALADRPLRTSATRPTTTGTHVTALLVAKAKAALQSAFALLDRTDRPDRRSPTIRSTSSRAAKALFRAPSDYHSMSCMFFTAYQILSSPLTSFLVYYSQIHSENRSQKTFINSVDSCVLVIYFRCKLIFL